MIYRYVRYGVALCLILGGFFAETVFADGVQRQDRNIVMTWERTPLNIVLPVGHEKIVSFPLPMKLGLNNNLLREDFLKVQNNHKTLYLLAKKSFSPQRIQVNLENGLVILINLYAEENAPSETVDIVLPDVKNGQPRNMSEMNEAALNYADMARFAIHQLYAPEDLLKSDSRFQRYPMESRHIVSLFLNQSALAMPLASWQTHGFFVTAIQVKNLGEHNLKIEPQTLCGRWAAASFYPRQQLAPKNSINRRDGLDSTTLFLISKNPFSKAIEECLRGD